ncbi:MAG: 3-phosphoshikimate 1-carboxyvinyltransferase [Anaerolineales bacterium]|nr:3-phosphoshikimate 1-carboxyvinyltransferase [Anaerolineales bacterium]
MTPASSRISNLYPVTPVASPLDACVRVPGSKSLTNRALLLAALADGVTTLRNSLFADDTQRFIESLQRLGFSIEQRPAVNGQPSAVVVHGLGGRIPAARAELFVGNAGTAARFLTALLALGQGEYVLDGDARMRERPIGDLLLALRRLGVNVEPRFPSSDLSCACPPLVVHANGLPGGKTTVAGNISSQFLSGLLMVAPYARGPLEIAVVGELNSKPYVEMTLALMRDFGVYVEHTDLQTFHIQPQRYRAQAEHVVESDASAASYFFAAPALCGGTVRVENISRRSKQGDVAFLDVLAQMGCTVTEGEDGIAVTGPDMLRGVEVDLRDIPDTAQTLAAIAPFACTPTTIRGIASARVKETDRVAAMCAELRRLGVSVEEYPDGLKIYPAHRVQPATVRTYNDHRMAMAFALVGLRVRGVVIENPACVSKTFPEYFQVLESLNR